jgi:aspartyl protease family protein
MGKQALILLALGAALMLGYSYRDDLSDAWGRVIGTVVPGRGVEVAPGIVRFQADEGGQFFINAKVNGTGVHFLVDTGASGIALSRRDAERLGFDAHDLSFTAIFSTANGTTRGAPVTLGTMEIGPFEAHQVHAWVNEGDLDDSLLGMNYLRTLGRIEIRGDTLIIESAAGSGTD